MEFSTLAVDNRIPQGPFGFSFLSWQGNKISFEQSSWLVYILMTLTLVCLLSLFIFRKPLSVQYAKNQKNILVFFQTFSAFIVLLSIFRAIILYVGKYPNLWEIIPFHFCRLFIILICLFLLVKKVEWVKYVGFFAICGGIVGIVMADLHSNDYWNARGGIKIGYDSYIFWDFYLIHISSVLVSQYFLMVNRFKILKWDVLITSVSLISLTTGLFFLNWFFSYLENEAWKSNWFYVGPNNVNGIDDTLSKYLGIIATWPLILFLFIFIGIVLYSSALFLYFYIDKFEIDFKNKPIVKVRTSQLWKVFKESSWI